MRPPRDIAARRLPGLLIAAVVVGGCAPGPAAGGAPPLPSSAAPASGVEVLSDATLPRIALARFLPGAPGWPDQLAAGAQTAGNGNPSTGPAPTVDHGIALGGVGSDLYPADAPDDYWMITDRGPNGQIKLKGPNRRTFPVPSFDPLILRVHAPPGAPLSILQVIPLTTADGQPVTGLPNDADRDEKPYDLTATTELLTNPSGLDPEGMVRSANGEFWLSEEYSPSILHVSPSGTVLARYVPQGLPLPGAGYPVTDSLPAVLAERQPNRGFESLAISADGRTVYAAMQSPLVNPDKDTAATSRVIRVLALDVATGKPTAEYAYLAEDVAAFDPGAQGDQSAMKISAMSWYGPDQLLVDERTDEVTRLYLVRLSGATNILGGELDDPAHTPALEAAVPAGVTPLAKTLLLDLTGTVPSAPTKIEGVAVRDPSTVAVANDNDFGMRDGPGAFDAQGNQLDTGIPSRLLLLHLPPR
jgi:Esterase-like activity of phytase